MGLVGCPTANVSVLRNRQELIHGLINTGLADQVSASLNSERVKDGEKQLLSSWDERAEYPSSILKMFYRYQQQFDQVANGSPLALDVGIAYDHARKILKIGTQIATTGVILFYAANTILPFAPPNFVAYAGQVATKFIGTRGLAFASNLNCV
jgi:hypothetical protein